MTPAPQPFGTNADPQAPTVSVIVPVYNTRQYLLNCVLSILSQERVTLELVIIDDGSTDGGIDELLTQINDERLLVVRQQQQGQAAARNHGITMASGTYIAFVDSDDTLRPNALARMVNLMESSGADVVNAGIEFIDEQTQQQVTRFVPKKPRLKLLGVEQVRNYLLGKDILASPCNKLYRAHLFKDIGVRFPHMSVNEDMLFVLDVVTHSTVSAFLPYICYSATRRSQSLTRSMSLRNLHDGIQILTKARAFLHSVGLYNAVRTEFAVYYTRFLLFLVTRAAKRGCDLREWWKTILRQSDYTRYANAALSQADAATRVLILLGRIRAITLLRFLPYRVY